MLIYGFHRFEVILVPIQFRFLFNSTYEFIFLIRLLLFAWFDCFGLLNSIATHRIYLIKFDCIHVPNFNRVLT